MKQEGSSEARKTGGKDGMRIEQKEEHCAFQETLFNHRAPASWRRTVERIEKLGPGESVWKGMQDGRKLDPLKPSFTLRSGCRHVSCGYIVHPTQPRMLTARECCRLQSFPDDFRVFGTVIEQFKQIGNAVPPLLARAVATEIRGRIHPKGDQEPVAMSLFSGAGGFSLGFRMAGFRIVLALDSDKYCARTYTHNFPDAKFILKDIQKTSVKELKEALGGNKPDIIIAGVPCQGFSVAGRRMIDDPRNVLYKDYVRIVAGIRPKWISMENVVGLLSMKTVNGTLVSDEIVEDFHRIGFRVGYKVLNAADYGVPQLRHRVLFIGNRVKERITFPAATHSSTPQRTLEDKVLMPYTSVSEAISDLPYLRAGEGSEESEYCDHPKTPFQKYLRGEMTYQQWISDQTHVVETVIQ
jgi:DNA (cytosine-5)-methyltransferase 1